MNFNNKLYIDNNGNQVIVSLVYMCNKVIGEMVNEKKLYSYTDNIIDNSISEDILIKDVDYLKKMAQTYNLKGLQTEMYDPWYERPELFNQRMQTLGNTIIMISSIINNNRIYIYQLPTKKSEKNWLNYNLDRFYHILAKNNSKKAFVKKAFLMNCKKYYKRLSNEKNIFKYNFLRLYYLKCLYWEIREYEC